MSRRLPRSKGECSPKRVWGEWMAADEAGDTVSAVALADELLTLDPDSSFSWFHAGLLSKALGRWQESAYRNANAVELYTRKDAKAFDGESAAARNLGIAATALGDWEQARAAWRAYGIEVDDGNGPIDDNFGLCPIRINPEPAIPHQIVPNLGATAVVWCQRRSPAHGVIASVPLPESGHRFGNVVLHDGQPRGSRMVDGREVPVFDELARLQDSGLPTWQASVVGADDGDVHVLSDLLGSRGLGVDEWSGIRVLCAQCSLGSPDAGHSHGPNREDATRLGFTGEATALRSALDEWLDAHQHVALLDFERLW